MEVLLSKNHYCSYCLLPVFFYRKRQLSESLEKLFEKRKNLYGVIYRRVEGLSAFLPAFFICPKMSLHFYGSSGTSRALQNFPNFQGFTGFSKVAGLYRTFQSCRLIIIPISRSKKIKKYLFFFKKVLTIYIYSATMYM